MQGSKMRAVSWIDSGDKGEGALTHGRAAKKKLLWEDTSLAIECQCYVV